MVVGGEAAVSFGAGGEVDVEGEVEGGFDEGVEEEDEEEGLE